jgi:DNA modification methylase
VHTVCTSPPYFGLRDYGKDGQIGLEATPEEFVAALVGVFREVKRVLRDDGTLWLNLGDSYASTTSATGARGGSFASERAQWQGEVTRKAIPDGLKAKDLIGIPWRVAFALQTDGWYLRQDIIWSKPSCMPESVTDRCTKAHEYVFLLAHPDSGGKYYYDAAAVAEPLSEATTSDGRYQRSGSEETPYGATGSGKAAGLGRGPRTNGSGTRNKRSVWTVNPKPYAGSHFAVWPPELVRPMILAGCPVGGTVLDVFSGSATTGMVALQEGRNYIGTDLNSEYLPLAEARIREERPPETKTEDTSGGIFNLFDEGDE